MSRRIIHFPCACTSLLVSHPPHPRLPYKAPFRRTFPLQSGARRTDRLFDKYNDFANRTVRSARRAAGSEQGCDGPGNCQRRQPARPRSLCQGHGHGSRAASPSCRLRPLVVQTAYGRRKFGGPRTSSSAQLITGRLAIGDLVFLSTEDSCWSANAFLSCSRSC